MRVKESKTALKDRYQSVNSMDRIHTFYSCNSYGTLQFLSSSLFEYFIKRGHYFPDFAISTHHASFSQETF